MPYKRWNGPLTSTFTPPSKPDQASCIDHLTIWDPEGLTTQAGHTQTISTSFLGNGGVLGQISVPLLIPPAPVIPDSTKPPRVTMLKYPVPPHALAALKTQVAVDLHSPIARAIATVNAILNLEDSTPIAQPATTLRQHPCDKESIHPLAEDHKKILGSAMGIAKTMFPLKATAPNKGQTLPRHIWRNRSCTI